MKISVIFSFQDRSLLPCLFHSVASVISRMFFKMNKSKNFTPGYIMVLHTFGRDLKWNPHIHCLISRRWLQLMTGSGAISPILIILSSETPFVLRYLTKWKACLVPLSKRSKPYVIPNTNKVSMFMPNRINAIQKRSQIYRSLSRSPGYRYIQN